jgi:hypothetical protein
MSSDKRLSPADAYEIFGVRTTEDDSLDRLWARTRREMPDTLDDLVRAAKRVMARPDEDDLRIRLYAADSLLKELHAAWGWPAGALARGALRLRALRVDRGARCRPAIALGDGISTSLALGQAPE